MCDNMLEQLGVYPCHTSDFASFITILIVFITGCLENIMY